MPAQKIRIPLSTQNGRASAKHIGHGRRPILSPVYSFLITDLIDTNRGRGRRSVCPPPRFAGRIPHEASAHRACQTCARPHTPLMFVVTEADADAIRTVFYQEGELS